MELSKLQFFCFFSEDETEEQDEAPEERYLKMPASKNLRDKPLLAYAFAKIRFCVQNNDLKQALLKCVRAIQRTAVVGVDYSFEQKPRRKSFV